MDQSVNISAIINFDNQEQQSLTFSSIDFISSGV